MYTFNDYQYESYAEALLKQVKGTKQEYIDYIKDLLMESPYFDKVDRTYEMINRAIVYGTAVGNCTSLITSLINKTPFPELLIPLAGVTTFGLIESGLNFGITGVITAKKLNKDAEREYSHIIAELEETLSENRHVAEDQIHSITESVRSGELEEKFKLSDGGEKLEIATFRIPENENYITEPIYDPSLLRVYEVLLHISNIAYDGYENDMKIAFEVIKRYVHDRLEGIHKRDNLYDAYFHELEKKCATIARTRKRLEN